MKRSARGIVFTLLFGAVLASGCASAPTRPPGTGVLFARPPDAVYRAAIDALTVHGFDVTKSDPLHVEGFRPRKVGMFVGSGGETVGVWLEPAGAAQTRVHVRTAKSSFGIAGQKGWDADILSEMEKALGTSR